MDPFLDKRLATYDRWLKQEMISFSSRVIPVHASLSASQWVLPSDQAASILQTMHAIAVMDCDCRSHYRRCDHPLEACLQFNTFADKLVSQGKARPIDRNDSLVFDRSACIGCGLCVMSCPAEAVSMVTRTTT